MKADKLLDWLGAVGVPPEVVSIGSEADNAWCLIHDEGAEGDATEAGWEVFWREQGNRYDWARFTSEQVACFYLFGRLTWTQAVRRVLTVQPDASTGQDQPAAQQAPAQQPPVQPLPGPQAPPMPGSPVPPGWSPGPGQAPPPAAGPGQAMRGPRPVDPSNHPTPAVGLPLGPPGRAAGPPPGRAPRG